MRTSASAPAWKVTWPVVLFLLLVGCAGGADLTRTTSDDDGGPPGHEDDGSARITTPAGEAAAELLLADETVQAGEEVTFRLLNTGQVELLTGLPYHVERWDGLAWSMLPESADGPRVWLGIGFILRPGDHTEAQTWPLDETPVEPGWYRIVKSATYEDPDGPASNLEVVARARFRVLG